MIVETWFPTYIGFEINGDHKKISAKLSPIVEKLKTTPKILKTNGYLNYTKHAIRMTYVRIKNSI